MVRTVYPEVSGILKVHFNCSEGAGGIHHPALPWHAATGRKQTQYWCTRITGRGKQILLTAQSRARWRRESDAPLEEILL